jgi:hypothetical protein
MLACSIFHNTNILYLKHIFEVASSHGDVDNYVIIMLILYSTHSGNKNDHMGDLVEHVGLFFHEVALPVQGILYPQR